MSVSKFSRLCIDMKICSKCKVEKDESEFHKKTGDKLQSHCKECQRIYIREHYARNVGYYVSKAKRAREKNTEWYYELKNTLKCETCGETHPATLDFHHRDPNEKEMSVSIMIRKFGKKRVLEEIQKCKVLCCKCHRILHWNEIHPAQAIVVNAFV